MSYYLSLSESPFHRSHSYPTTTHTTPTSAIRYVTNTKLCSGNGKCFS